MVTWQAIGVLALALVAWNTVTNLMPPPAWAYLPANLALAGAALWWARRRGISLRDVGLAPARVHRGVAVGIGVAVVVAFGILLATQTPAAAVLLEDERAAEPEGWVLAYTAALRIPLGTALTEELLFRGILIAALLRRTGLWWAVGISSVVFGLWHIGPAIALLEANEVVLPVAGVVAYVAATVVGTTLAGVGFWLLRAWSGSLLAPIIAHAAINSFSLLAAATSG